MILLEENRVLDGIDDRPLHGRGRIEDNRRRDPRRQGLRTGVAGVQQGKRRIRVGLLERRGELQRVRIDSYDEVLTAVDERLELASIVVFTLDIEHDRLPLPTRIDHPLPGQEAVVGNRQRADGEIEHRLAEVDRPGRIELTADSLGEKAVGARQLLSALDRRVAPVDE